jgi:hypothetical protein
MHYSFDAYPLLYVAAALAIFGVPMTCIFLAAMRGMVNSQKQLRSTQPSVAKTLTIVKPQPPVKAKPAKITRKRALDISVRWVSLPVNDNANYPAE